MRTRLALAILCVALFAGLGLLLWTDSHSAAPDVVAMEPTTNAPPGDEVADVVPLVESEELRSGSTRVPAPVETARELAPEPRARGIVLSGSVTSPRGTKLGGAGARVRLDVTDERGMRRSSSIREGGYGIASLSPGPVDVACEVEGFRSASRRVLLSENEPLHREDFTLEPEWTIAVHLVTPTGESLLGAIPREDLHLWFSVGAAATKLPPERKLGSRRKGHRLDSEIGRYVDRAGLDGGVLGELALDCSGRLVVLGEPPVYVSVMSGEHVLDTRRVDTLVDRLTLEIPVEQLLAVRCGAALLVTDFETGNPLPLARVNLAGPEERKLQLTTDESGVGRLDKLLPGRYRLYVGAADHAPAALEVELEPGRENDLGTIALDAEVTFRGRYVDPDGRPVFAMSDLAPFTKDDPLDPWRHFQQHWIRGDLDGRFEALHVPRGNYVLVFREGAELQAAPKEIDLTRGSIDDMVIQVRRTVSVKLQRTEEIAGSIRAWIVSREGLPCRQMNWDVPGPRIVGLVPGDYELLLQRDEAIVRRLPFALREEPITLDIDL